MKSLTGQYECMHRSGLGLDYFTARLDRLTLLGNGRFTYITQDKSRIANAARSLLSGEQANTNAPETKREGSYSVQGNLFFLRFDDGTQEQGEIQADGMQIGQNYFEKVSDSTLLPPTHRMKSNMEDIAKGLKIAGAIGGAAMKAAKTIQDTIQASQANQQGQPQNNAAQQPPQANPVQSPQSQYQVPVQPVQPAQPHYAAPIQSVPASPAAGGEETLFCDQCGAPVRPGKKFCSRCGARLP